MPGVTVSSPVGPGISGSSSTSTRLVINGSLTGIASGRLPGSDTAVQVNAGLISGVPFGVFDVDGGGGAAVLIASRRPGR